MEVLYNSQVRKDSMMSKKPSYQQATQSTAKDLQTVAKTVSVQQLSRLSLPEVDAVVELISKIMPAGNVPGMILSGLDAPARTSYSLLKRCSRMSTLCSAGSSKFWIQPCTAPSLQVPPPSFGAIKIYSNLQAKILKRRSRKACGNFMRAMPCAKTQPATQTKHMDSTPCSISTISTSIQ